jgi:DNA-binding transcriptional ArsR family regulator
MLFAVLSHPMRIRIVEELSNGERDVNSLVKMLGLNQSSVSQHLALLRTHRLVFERKEGRHIFYSLRDKKLASWALDGVGFVGLQQFEVDEFHSAVAKARDIWSQPEN